MSRYKQPKQELINHLLFSSQGDDSHNLSHEHSYNDVDEAEEEFIYKMANDDKWNSNDNIEKEFIQINGPSVEFSQNYSQSSMMLSHRQDEDSRDYKRDGDRRYFKLLEEKKREEIQFNEALDQELNATRQELDRSKLQISKLQGINKGLESKLKSKDEEIAELQHQIEELQAQVEKMRVQKTEIFEVMNKKNDFFDQYKKESTKILGQLNEKDRENNMLKKEIISMQLEFDKFNLALAVYNDSDHRLLDFRSNYSQPPYESPLNSRKNSLLDKELEKLKKQKNSLQIELSAMGDKLEDRENRFKLVEEQHKKKISLKEKRISELEQKLSELREDQVRAKTQYDISLEKANGNLAAKNKEISLLNEKVSEFEKRIKAMIQDSRKKDEKVKEISLQTLEKGRQLGQIQKQLEEMKIKIEFDHHMIQDKDREIDKLLQEKKLLKIQIESNEKQEKSDKLEKNEKEKVKRDIEKHKKDNETLRRQIDALKKETQGLRKQIEVLEKEKEEIAVSSRESKRKFDQVSKKMVQLRSNQSHLEEDLHSKAEELEMQKEALDRAMRELTQYKKKYEAVPELKNKIILLESRLKNEQIREANDSYESSTLQDRIEALEQRLEERDKENKSLKAQLRTGHCSDEELKEIEFELAERDEMLEKMEEELDKRERVIQQLKRELEFKDHTLDFTHKILVNSQKAKIQLQQQKKLLEEMVNREEEQSFQGTREELAQFYQQKIEQLEMKLEGMARLSREKEDEHRFELKQQKERIRELNDMLLSKQRKITPETMSQEETVNLLIKIIKRVNRSADMLRILARNHEFREGLMRMDKQFRK